MTQKYACLLLLLLLGCNRGTLPSHVRDQEPDPGLARLWTGASGNRTLRVRLTGFEYAPWGEDRGAREVKPISASGLAAIEGPITREIKRGPSPQALSHLGLFYLLSDPRDDAGPMAVRELEAAVARDPYQAGRWNDLAAALWIEAITMDEPFALLEAHHAATRALDLLPHMPEALFNLALILEELHLKEDARQAWQAYLRVDAASGWAEEARTALGETGAETLSWDQAVPLLRQAVGLGDDQRTRELAGPFLHKAMIYWERQLLAAWGETGDESVLYMAGTLAKALEQESGDPFYPDTIRFLSQANDPALVLALRRGHQLFPSAAAHFDDRETEAARLLFEEIHSQFQGTTHPFQARIDYYLAACESSVFHNRAALNRLNHLAREIPQGYANILGEAYWVMGMCHWRENRPQIAKSYFEKGGELFHATGHRENLVGIYAMLADILDYLGEAREAWRYLIPALAELDPSLKLRRFEQSLNAAAYLCSEANYPKLALRFLSAAIRTTQNNGNPHWKMMTHLHKARVHHQLGEKAETQLEWNNARKIWKRMELEDPEYYRRVEPDLLITESMLGLGLQDRERIQLLERAVLENRIQGNRTNEAAHLFLLARLYQAQADQGDAERALTHCLELYEEERKEKGPNSDGFYARESRVLEELLTLLRNQGRHAEALVRIEQMRARVLLDHLAHNPSVELGSSGEVAPTLLPLKNIQAALPEKVTAIVYANAGGSLFAWTLNRHTLQNRFITDDLDGLRAEIIRFCAEIDRGAPRSVTTDTSRRLYDLLIRPMAGYLPGEGGRLVLVPDHPLHRLPFAALMGDARYLVEDYALAYAPSLNVYVSCLARSRMESSPNGALVVGNPKLSRTLAHDFSNLPGAEAEAEDIANLYADIGLPFHLLKTADAGKIHFLNMAGNFGLIHFAGHARVHPLNPLMSKLLLAGNGSSDDGVLYAHELYDLALPRTHLAILSACSTSGHGQAEGEGLTGLARPFLAMGVPGVVATQWDIGDWNARDLMVDFHRNLLQGADAAHALQTAQIEALRHATRIQHWAAFQLIGHANPMAGRAW